MRNFNQLLCFAAAAVILCTPFITYASSSLAAKSDPRQLLKKLAAFAPDPCASESANFDDWHPAANEMQLLTAASDAVLEALNTRTETPLERANRALEPITAASQEINAVWPKENRFRFEILDLKQVLIVTLAIRAYSRYFVFGVGDGEPNQQNRAWRHIDLDQDEKDFDVPWMGSKVYPLQGGPSGNARFLARVIRGGCAGSYGIAYDAREWAPTIASAQRIIGVEGAMGLDDKAPGFPQIGELHTGGRFVDLPYCWWSPVDTWDNPSMCAVDRFDLAGDAVGFVSRRVNRPDILPIAKAVEYANRHDFGAVRGYCVSDAVARRLVRRSPGSSLFDVEVKVKRLAAGRELVYSESGDFRFTVEKQGDRWLVRDFSEN